MIFIQSADHYWWELYIPCKALLSAIRAIQLKQLKTMKEIRILLVCLVLALGEWHGIQCTDHYNNMHFVVIDSSTLYHTNTMGPMGP